MIGPFQTGTGIESIIRFVFSPEVRAGIAISVGIYLVWTLYQRAFLTDADPSITLSAASDTGGANLMLYGQKVTLFLSGIIVLVTWPLARNSTAFVVLLGVANIVHWIIERREVD